MKSLLRKKRNHKHDAAVPIGLTFPKLRDAEIAAVTAGGRNRNFCDSFRTNSVRVLFGLIEFSVRGYQTAKLVPAVDETFRTAGMQALSARDINESDAMTEICLRLNRSLIEIEGPAHSCPAFLGCYNEDLGTVCYVNAGHTPGLVRHSSDISQLGATGLPLGLFSHTTLEAGIIALEPGAAMIIVSKQVVEAQSRDGEFGLTRVAAALKRSTVVSAHDLCLSVIQATHQYSTQAKAHELTALSVIRRIT